GERVVVQAAWELPYGTRPERLVGLEPEQERLEIVEAVEGRHRPRERARRRSVDPADALPEVGLGQSFQEAELEEDAVDSTPRQDDRDVAAVRLGHEAIVPRWSRSSVLPARYTLVFAGLRTRRTPSSSVAPISLRYRGSLRPRTARFSPANYDRIPRG